MNLKKVGVFIGLKIAEIVLAILAISTLVYFISEISISVHVLFILILYAVLCCVIYWAVVRDEYFRFPILSSMGLSIAFILGLAAILVFVHYFGMGHYYFLNYIGVKLPEIKESSDYMGFGTFFLMLEGVLGWGVYFWVLKNIEWTNKLVDKK